MSEETKLVKQLRNSSREFRHEAADLIESLQSDNAELREGAKQCGDCGEPIRPACRCAEHLRICEEQQKGEALRDQLKQAHSGLRKKFSSQIGPTIFKSRALLCSSCSGKGTGLLCSACCEGVAAEMDAMREKVTELTKDLDGWREESRRMTEDNARLCRDMESLRATAEVVERAGMAFHYGSAGYILWEYKNEMFIAHCGRNSLAPHTRHPTLLEALAALADEGEAG